MKTIHHNSKTCRNIAAHIQMPVPTWFAQKAEIAALTPNLYVEFFPEVYNQVEGV